jgi:hypothetical protein
VRFEGYGLIPQRSREYQRRILYSTDVIDDGVLRTERFVGRKDRRFVVSMPGTF